MTELEQSILAALLDLEEAAGAMRGPGPKPDLRPLLVRLDELTAQLPRDADPNLLHYLHRKSYEKAKLLLQGRDAQNVRGTCH